MENPQDQPFDEIELDIDSDIPNIESSQDSAAGFAPNVPERDPIPEEEERILPKKDIPADDPIEKDKMLRYLENIKSKFDRKSNIGRSNSLEEIESEIKRFERSIINKGFTGGIDKLYSAHNRFIGFGASALSAKMQGIDQYLEKNQELKDCFTLMILKRFNPEFSTPEMKYMYLMMMTAVQCYSVNTIKERANSSPSKASPEQKDQGFSSDFMDKINQIEK